MTCDASVICPGVVFSSLLSEHVGFPEVQEGFLLGSSVQHTSTHISDSDMSNETTKKTVYISSYHSLDYLGCLYDSGSRVRQHTLDHVVQMAAINKQEVVGWYRRRCCTDSWDRVFLRERLVHQQLREKLGNKDLLFLILNWRRDGADAFPTTNYLLHTCAQKEFVRVPLSISNLRNTSNTDYKLDPPNPAIYSSPALGNIITSLHSSEPGVQEATQLHAQLEESLKQQLQQLSQVQQQHSSKLKQLMALRSLCYLNGIVPDFELPSEIGREKQHDSEPKEVLKGADMDSTPELLTGDVQKEVDDDSSADTEQPTHQEVPEPQPKIVTEKETLVKEKSPTNRLPSATPGSRSEVKRKLPFHENNSISDIDNDLNKLSVNGTAIGQPPKDSVRATPAKGGTPSRGSSKTACATPLKGQSPNGRLGSESCASPPGGRRALSGGRVSRTPSATKQRRRPISSSPSQDNHASASAADKNKNVWK